MKRTANGTTEVASEQAPALSPRQFPNAPTVPRPCRFATLVASGAAPNGFEVCYSFGNLVDSVVPSR
jgi:hypothetical protein